MSKLGPKYDAAAAHDRAHNAAHECWDQQLSFHAVAGSRLKRVQNMVGDAGLIDGMKTLMVVTEVCRPISFLFQQAAEGRLRVNRPYACDLATVATSPIVQCQQYVASFVSNAPAPSMRLVWGGRGHATIGDWAVARPAELSALRRAALLVHSSLTMRHEHLLEAPYNWACVVDDRVPEAVAADVLHRTFAIKNSRCLRPGVARAFKEQWPADVSASSAQFKEFVFTWSLSLFLSISDVERLHAVNKSFNQNRAGGGTKWSSIASNAVNKSASATLAKREALLADDAARRQLLARPAGPAGSGGSGAPIPVVSSPASSSSMGLLVTLSPPRPLPRPSPSSSSDALHPAAPPHSLLLIPFLPTLLLLLAPRPPAARRRAPPGSGAALASAKAAAKVKAQAAKTKTPKDPCPGRGRQPPSPERRWRGWRLEEG